jgi:hypothetical protein
LQESLVRLSTWIPSFTKAAAELAWFTQVEISRETARRLSEAAGAVLVTLQTEAAERILHEHPTPPAGPDMLVFSVDGAMIPLVHGVWTEVRTLAVGEVEPLQPRSDAPVSHTSNVSYFSRRTDNTTFADQALLELHRRGIETANRVGAVVDGAEWCQQFIDLHKPDALRILDFAHAAEYVSAIGQSAGEDGPLLNETQLAQQLHALKHSGPQEVLSNLRALLAAQPTRPELAKQLAYLEKREGQMQYPDFLSAGWPIGSGIVESANKLVVEDRLKGAGMHWADEHVNPMLALRNAVCNDRWVEVWTLIEGEQRRQVAVRRQERQQRRQVAAKPTGTIQTAARAQAAPEETAVLVPAPTPSAEPASKDGRPAANHPWRKAWSVRRQREQASAA